MKLIHLPVIFVPILSLAMLACTDLSPSQGKSPLAIGVEVGARPVAVFAEESWLPVEATLPASQHPYANYTFRRWVVSAPDCARSMRVKFDRIDVERDYDAVVLRDGEGNMVQHWTGDLTDVVSEAVPGASLQIELISDYSVTGWGFSVSQVEMIEQLPSCPRYMIPACPDGSVALQEPAPQCGCPPPPRCQSMQGAVVELVTGGGFSGQRTGYRVDGSGTVWALSSFPGQQFEATPYGQANPSPVRELVLALYSAGLLGQPVDRGEWGNMTRSLTTTFAGVSSTLYWPAEANPPAEAMDPLTAWKQILACDDGSDRYATCAEGRTCFDTVCALNTCANVRCAAGTRCEMQYQNCAQVPCPSVPACVPDATVCTCEPDVAPVCSDNGVTHDNECLAACAGSAVRHPGACWIEGDSCGGILGLACQEHHLCRHGVGEYNPPYPDATGTCVAEGYCEEPVDCSIYPHVLCLGAWTCVDARCDFECNAQPAETWHRDALDFGSSDPYDNNQALGWRIDGDAGTTQIRLSFSAFDLEQDYDFVTLYDASWNEIWSYTGALGSFVSDAVEGQTMYLVFRSDHSIVSSGFHVDAMESLQP